VDAALDRAAGKTSVRKNHPHRAQSVPVVERAVRGDRDGPTSKPHVQQEKIRVAYRRNREPAMAVGTAESGPKAEAKSYQLFFI
jgi:hypothetical protein